jgi:glycosyltransferase involved in cell wall biosynthesis
VLYRHLVNQPDVDLEIYGKEPEVLAFWTLVRRLIGRFRRTKLRRWSEDIWFLLHGRWIDPMLPSKIDERQSALVMTVAHGDGFMAARRFAERHQLPLVALFQDWWPDIAEVHGCFRQPLERKFLELAEHSSVAICISEGMKRALGSTNCVVLPPIPGVCGLQSPLRSRRKPDRKLRVVYSGNLSEYGPMLGEALKVFETHDRVELVVRGSRPRWSPSFAAEMKQKGKWLEFAPRTELEIWLENSDAFLVPMEFDPAKRRRMETSFPSKLIEFAQFGKPLVVWGPEYCSAVEWARINNIALCVTDPSPVYLLHALIDLASSQPDQERYALAASQAAKSELSPAQIQSNMLAMLKNAVACGLNRGSYS